MIARAVAAVLLAGLCGCAAQNGGSVAGGECRAFERPPYALRGATRYDQDVADNYVESGVGACGWQRPAARPPEIDAQPALKPAPKPVRKRSVLRRIKDKVWPHGTVAPVTAAPEAPVPVAEEAPSAPAVPAPKPKRPLTAIEELLHLRSADDE